MLRAVQGRMPSVNEGHGQWIPRKEQNPGHADPSADGDSSANLSPVNKNKIFNHLLEFPHTASGRYAYNTSDCCSVFLT